MGRKHYSNERRTIMKMLLLGLFSLMSFTAFASGNIYAETDATFACVENVITESCETVVYPDSANTFTICKALVMGVDVNNEKKLERLHSQKQFYRERGAIKRFFQHRNHMESTRAEINTQIEDLLEATRNCEEGH
jgi:hypothetical protein